MKKIAKVAFLSLAFLPLLASAAFGFPFGGGGGASSGAGGGQPPIPASSNPLDQLLGYIDTATNWFLGALIVLAGIFVVYAGFKYLTAAGSEEDIKAANKIIIYAVVAVAIGLASKIIVALATALIKK